MTQEEKLDLVRRHYDLTGAANYPAAQELLTDDFSITIPSSLPFGGTYLGKGAFVELIPIVAKAVTPISLRFIETAVSEDSVVQIVEFILEGNSASTYVAELIRFRGDQICEIKPFYSDVNSFMTAAARKGLATRHGQE